MGSTDSSSNLTDVLRLAKSADNFTSTVFYDSSGTLPTDSAFIGTLARDNDGTVFIYDGTNWTRPNQDGSITLYSFQGTVSGYLAGGISPPASPPATINTIQKYSFTSDANATDVGDLPGGRQGGAGQKSSTHGYNSGGSTPTPGPSLYSNAIEKYAYATDENASDVADLTTPKTQRPAGASSSVSGYVAGGDANTSGTTIIVNVIEKFPFTADDNATDVGDLTESRRNVAGDASSSTHGYRAGGNTPTVDTIDKFSFSVDGNATDVGDLLTVGFASAGQSSSTHGYVSGLQSPGPVGGPTQNVIQKYSFSVDGNATDVGDLTTVARRGTGSSSTTSGYTAGGRRPSIANNIDKFPFASDANATDVGDLLDINELGSGSQV